MLDRCWSTPDRPAKGKQITFFFTEDYEFHAIEPVAQVFEARGYQVIYCEDVEQPAEIGVYCSHRPDPTNARFSIAMLHDLGQEQWPECPSREPNFWNVSPWNGFDIGILPGRAWAQCWYSVSWHANARPRLGVFELGWPKADRIFTNQEAFGREVAQLQKTLGIKNQPSVLYAPSWENDGKIEDFVGSLRRLPVNLLIKEAYSPDEKERNRLAEITSSYRDLENVYVIDPKVNIMPCLAISDVVVSDRSNCLVEALFFEVSGIGVTDWLVPDLPTKSYALPPPCATKTNRTELRVTVEHLLLDRAGVRPRLRQWRDYYFSHLGKSSVMIVDVIDAALKGVRLPVEPLMPKQSLSPSNAIVGDPAREAGVLLSDQTERKPPPPPAPVINDFGPRVVKAGTLFNVQPSGKSAIWFNVRNVTNWTVVVFEDHELRTVVARDGHTVTAIVPFDLVQSPGQHAIFLFDKWWNQKSNIVILEAE